MNIYFERFLICSRCEDVTRQTATKLPLDEMARKISGSFIYEFRQLHPGCNIRVTSWRAGKFNFLNKSRK